MGSTAQQNSTTDTVRNSDLRSFPQFIFHTPATLYYSGRRSLRNESMWQPGEKVVCSKISQGGAHNRLGCQWSLKARVWDTFSETRGVSRGRCK